MDWKNYETRMGKRRNRGMGRRKRGKVKGIS